MRVRVKVFSKRHAEAEVSLEASVRQRIWYAMTDHDPFFLPTGFNDSALIYDALPERLLREHVCP